MSNRAQSAGRAVEKTPTPRSAAAFPPRTRSALCWRVCVGRTTSELVSPRRHRFVGVQAGRRSYWMAGYGALAGIRPAMQHVGEVKDLRRIAGAQGFVADLTSTGCKRKHERGKSTA